MHAGKVQTHFRHGGGAHSKNRERVNMNGEWVLGGKSDPLLRKATASPVVVLQLEQSQVGRG